MKKTNIIQRRDLEPLWQKANEVVRHYEKAADCITSVIGSDLINVECSKHPAADLFCPLCKRYSQCAQKMKSYEIPCSPMHCNAAKKARRYGGLYIYTCPVGFSFWTSPFFAGELFAGAFISSVISVNAQQLTLDKLYTTYKGNISRAEIARNIEEVPAKTDREIQALAQMMLLCAWQISHHKPYWNEADKHDKKHSQQPKVNLPDLSDKERLLVASMQRGDCTEAQNIARELLSSINAANSGNPEYFKLKVMELLVMLSRTGSNSQNNLELVETNSRYLQRIEALTDSEEITDYLCTIVEQMSRKIFSFRGLRHASALRKAERFIRENYLKRISLQEIAYMSGLSAPYFSTVFKDEMGENLSFYLNRLRVEKACSMLKETENSVSEISVACGFEDQSWFSKTFKNHTGLSPCKYRKLG